MAQILNFRTPELRSSEAGDRRHASSAEIILFPGIRYERWGEPQSGAADERGKARDVLELAE
jgi:hypothetical protein